MKGLTRTTIAVAGLMLSPMSAGAAPAQAASPARMQPDRVDHHPRRADPRVDALGTVPLQRANHLPRAAGAVVEQRHSVPAALQPLLANQRHPRLLLRALPEPGAHLVQGDVQLPARVGPHPPSLGSRADLLLPPGARRHHSHGPGSGCLTR